MKDGEVLLVKTKYCNGQRLRIEMAVYSNCLPAMSLVTAHDGEPWFKATVNIPGETPADGCAFFKDWEENEGLIDVLVTAGVIELTGRTVKSGYCMAKEGRIL